MVYNNCTVNTCNTDLQFGNLYSIALKEHYFSSMFDCTAFTVIDHVSYTCFDSVCSLGFKVTPAWTWHMFTWANGMYCNDIVIILSFTHYFRLYMYYLDSHWWRLWISLHLPGRTWSPRHTRVNNENIVHPI